MTRPQFWKDEDDDDDDDEDDDEDDDDDDDDDDEEEEEEEEDEEDEDEEDEERTMTVFVCRMPQYSRMKDDVSIMAQWNTPTVTWQELIGDRSRTSSIQKRKILMLFRPSTCSVQKRKDTN